MSGEMGIARQWVAKAANDLLNADNNFRSADVPFDTVCFHCQQAAEKLLKAYLVGKGQQYPISHDLFLILERVLSLDADAEQLRTALAIPIPYAVEIRYPDDWYMPSQQDAEEARRAADEVLVWARYALPELFESAPNGGIR